MKFFSRIALPFFCGLIILPSFVFLHECGHYAVAKCLGLSPGFHFKEVRIDSPRENYTAAKDVAVMAGGPMANFILMVAGFFCLRSLRRQRVAAPPTFIEWLATSFALNAGRGLRVISVLAFDSRPQDEGKLSLAAGMPVWFLPTASAAISVAFIIMTIRLHPPGGRLVPFCSIFLGGILGFFLWMNVVGPMLVP